jgi:hypothetical protein
MPTKVFQVAKQADVGDNRLTFTFGSKEHNLVAVECGNDTKKMLAVDIRLRDEVYPKGNSCNLADLAGVNGVAWTGSVKVSFPLILESTIYACAALDNLYMKFIFEE